MSWQTGLNYATVIHRLCIISIVLNSNLQPSESSTDKVLIGSDDRDDNDLAQSSWKLSRKRLRTANQSLRFWKQNRSLLSTNPTNFFVASRFRHCLMAKIFIIVVINYVAWHARLSSPRSSGNLDKKLRISIVRKVLKPSGYVGGNLQADTNWIVSSAWGLQGRKWNRKTSW